MKRTSIIVLFILISTSLIAQSYRQFKSDFKKSLDENFSDKELKKLITRYPNYIPRNLFDSIPSYPLKQIKDEKIYKENMPKFFRALNPNHRVLAYEVILCAGDKGYESLLMTKLKEEKDKRCFNQLLLTLMHLRTNRTTEFFDAMIENDTLIANWMVASSILMLNKDSLKRTAYLRIESHNSKVKSQAAALLGFTKLDSQTEMTLKSAAKDWNWEIKNYPIYALQNLHAPNLLETMKPIVDTLTITKRRNSLLLSYVFNALAKSPTEDDRKYLKDFAFSVDTLSAELMNSFLYSDDIDNLKCWLKLLYSRQVPQRCNYSHEAALHNDVILPDLQVAIQKVKDPYVLFWLLGNLEGRKDSTSTRILINYLWHADGRVRSKAAFALKGNPSPKINSILPKLIKDPLLRETSFTKLAIENRIHSLHLMYEFLFNQTTKDDEWHNSSIEYLSNFPKESYKKIFTDILKEGQGHAYSSEEKGNAALGLGRLKDRQSVDLIISVGKQEGAKLFYLRALGLIRGSKAKKEIKKYSRGDYKNQVADILKNW